MASSVALIPARKVFMAGFYSSAVRVRNRPLAHNKKIREVGNARQISPPAMYRLISARDEVYAGVWPSGEARNATNAMRPALSLGRTFARNEGQVRRLYVRSMYP